MDDSLLALIHYRAAISRNRITLLNQSIPAIDILNFLPNHIDRPMSPVPATAIFISG